MDPWGDGDQSARFDPCERPAFRANASPPSSSAGLFPCSIDGWLRDLTAEGVEPNPGPCSRCGRRTQAEVGPASANICTCPSALRRSSSGTVSNTSPGRSTRPLVHRPSISRSSPVQPMPQFSVGDEVFVLHQHRWRPAVVTEVTNGMASARCEEDEIGVVSCDLRRLKFRASSHSAHSSRSSSPPHAPTADRYFSNRPPRLRTQSRDSDSESKDARSPAPSSTRSAPSTSADRCVHFTGGWCDRGDACNFEHDLDAREARFQTKPRINQVCSFYAAGHCNRSKYCSYLHPELSSSPPTSEPMATPQANNPVDGVSGDEFTRVKNINELADKLFFFDGHHDKKLGSGGYATIYPASTVDDRDCAFKLMHNLTTDDQISSFKREIDALKLLKHEHVLGMIGICNDPPGLLLPRMDLSLDKVLRDKNARLLWRWDELTRVRVLLKAARGLAYMHKPLAIAQKPRVLHRDIKASNVLVSAAAGQPGVIDNVCLSDFGLSKIKSAMDSTNRSSVGTTLWMAPEIPIAGQDGPGYKAPADVWSFGALIYEVLTTRKPPSSLRNINLHASAGSKAQVLVGSFTSAPDSFYPDLVPQKAPHTSADLRSLMIFCLQVDPTRRPTMDVVCRRLEEIEQLILSSNVSAGQATGSASVGGSSLSSIREDASTVSTVAAHSSDDSDAGLKELHTAEDVRDWLHETLPAKFSMQHVAVLSKQIADRLTALRQGCTADHIKILASVIVDRIIASPNFVLCFNRLSGLLAKKLSVTLNAITIDLCRSALQASDLFTQDESIIALQTCMCELYLKDSQLPPDAILTVLDGVLAAITLEVSGQFDDVTFSAQVATLHTLLHGNKMGRHLFLNAPDQLLHTMQAIGEVVTAVKTRGKLPPAIVKLEELVELHGIQWDVY